MANTRRSFHRPVSSGRAPNASTCPFRSRAISESCDLLSQVIPSNAIPDLTSTARQLGKLPPAEYGMVFTEVVLAASGDPYLQAKFSHPKARKDVGVVTLA